MSKSDLAVGAGLILYLSITGVAAAATVTTDCANVDCVPRINTVQDLQALNATTEVNYPKVYLVSYGDASNNVTPQDGADGLFVQAPCNGRTDDGGSVIQDHNDTCFFRQNLNGDLRQWGITAGSAYDVIYKPSAEYPRFHPERYKPDQESDPRVSGSWNQPTAYSPGQYQNRA